MYAISGKGKAMNTAEIIQRLQDSEINGMISWFFDGEWRWAIGDDLNGWKTAGKADSFDAVVRELAENALAEFPRSTFANWWATQR
jgi:hypothetical protein